MFSIPNSLLLRKCRSACYHAREGWRRMQMRREARMRRQAFDSWVRELRVNPPDVLVGANFAEFGGTRQHIHAIKAFSSLQVALAPNDDSLKKMTGWLLQTEFRESFLQFKLQGIRAAHSHVFPWFIEWCHHQRRTNGLRWIHTHHNWYYPEFGRGELESWQKEFNEKFLFALQHADVCLSVSKWQRSFLKDSFGLETHYLPNGVDVAICDAAEAARSRQKTGLDHFILYAGRNDPVKNPADFVKLATLLPNQQFLMIGQGLSNVTMQDEWDVIVPPNLKVIGEATHRETLDAIAACSALVVTSKREGLPTLVLEAMALGKPVVVPEEAGCLEAIGHGEAGYVYHPGNIEHLAEKTLEAKHDTLIGEVARERVLREYDWRIVIRQLDRIYAGEPN